jgi:hypothetical protein
LLRDAVDPFAWHEIQQVSPSLVGYLQTDVAFALLQAVPAIRCRAQATPSAIRGRALDKALAFVAYRPDAPDDVVVEHADRVFHDQERDELAKGVAFDPAELGGEREALAGYLRAAVPHIRQWGPPLQSQVRVECEVEGLGVPLVGYADLLYPDRVRDLKTTERMPSSPSARHCKQVAPYAVATGAAPWLDYVTVREMRSFRVEDPAQYLQQVVAVLFAFRRLLATSRDIAEVCAHVAPNLENWCWDDVTRAAARQIWGVG